MLEYNPLELGDKAGFALRDEPCGHRTSWLENNRSLTRYLWHHNSSTHQLHHGALWKCSAIIANTLQSVCQGCAQELGLFPQVVNLCLRSALRFSRQKKKKSDERVVLWILNMRTLVNMSTCECWFQNTLMEEWYRINHCFGSLTQSWALLSVSHGLSMSEGFFWVLQFPSTYQNMWVDGLLTVNCP